MIPQTGNETKTDFADLLEIFRNAEKAAHDVDVLSDEFDEDMNSQLEMQAIERETARTTQALNVCYDEICSYSAKSVSDVLVKLNLWYEAVVGNEAGVEHLSIIDRLVLSAYTDMKNGVTG